ncbi:cupin domain-containing protein [Salinisphaera sp. SPP-AMP-43]|uniref:cupin domain-containing protein n=1 Tax=Salinisphaera sp. SPP-AMP-43 TaxID=3121288 RepID=UPI003C6E5069
MATQSTRQILQSYVTDYAHDPLAVTTTFGIRVDDQTYTVTIERQGQHQPWATTLTRGRPKVATWVWVTDRDTLERIAGGKLLANTTEAKAYGSDAAPLDIQLVNGQNGSENFFETTFRPVNQHFWLRGQPEIIDFAASQSRRVHGGHANVGVYASGIRTARYTIEPGDHINAQGPGQDSGRQSDPWTTLFYVISAGSATARIGDRRFALQTDSMITVPPDTRHEFWNDGDTPAELLMITYGSHS